METHPFLQYTVVLLLAAVVAVPIARHWRLGAVLGYLAFGALIGPSGLAVVGTSGDLEQISDLGVALLLFVIGLELSPRRLWVMRRKVFGLGTLQMAVTGVALGAIAFALGIGWKAALVVGLGLALSSTAIGLQTLSEHKQLGQPHGRAAFGILLFQDVAAIPLLALIPLLGGNHVANGYGDEMLAVARVVATIVAVIIGGRYLLRPMFRAAAKSESPEVFTATALLVVIGIAWLMELVGISMSLGAFLAGVLLADSEYRPEIEAQIEPFQGLLLGLFFVSVGMSLDFTRAVTEPKLVFAALAVLLAVKAAILFLIGRVAIRIDRLGALALAAVLSQGGEFAFVVFALAAGSGVLTAEQRGLLVLVVTLSMAATPLLVRLRLELAPDKPVEKPVRAFDRVDADTPRVIIAGMGRFGQIIARMLNANRIPFTSLDSDAEQVDFLRQFGNTVFYGDATRLELLRAAQADKAEAIVIAANDPETSLRTARLVKRHFPHLKVFARARNRQHVFRLMDLGVGEIIRDTYLSSLAMAERVLVELGFDAKVAAARGREFRTIDERLLAEQYLVYDDDAALIQTAKEARADLQRLFEADSGGEREESSA